MQTKDYTLKIQQNNEINSALDSNSKPAPPIPQVVEGNKSSFGGGFKMGGVQQPLPISLPVPAPVVE